METILYNLATAIVVLTSVVFLIFKYQYTYWKSRGIPHLKPTIPFGNLLRNSHLVYSLNKIYNDLKGRGPFVGAYMFLRPVTIATDLDLIKNILIKDFNVFSNRALYYNERDDPLSAHLFFLDGEKWKNMRTKLSPTFTSGKIKGMFPTIVRVGEEFKNVLSDLITINDNEMEFKELLARFMTDVIGTCAFGVDCNSLKDPNAEFRKYSRKMIEEIDGPLGRIVKNNFKKLSQFFHLKVTNQEASKFFLKIVRETIEFREKNNVKRNDFMDLLIDLKNGKSVDEAGKKLGCLTIEEITAQAALFFFAGFETSALTIAYVFYELALNPELQAKAREEINRILGKHGNQFTYDAMMEMTYIDQILNESLRKYPPAAVVFRTASEDYKVESTGEVIEKNQLIFIPIYSIHHDSDVYPNPEIFDPDRFLPEAVKSRHPLALLSFGDGPRNCIGMRFAKMQARIGIVTVLKSFKLSVCTKTPKNIEFKTVNPTLSSTEGIWLKVEKI